MLDHEEKFLFKEEILALANSMAEPGTLDNVEDLLTDVITSPRFDSEVFTLERSLQVMLGPRAGTTLVGLLTVAPEVFDEVAEVRIPPEVHERFSRLAAESLDKQREVEAADRMDFETFRRGYLAHESLTV